MHYDELRDLTHRAPFIPMRIIMNDGRAYELRHPDFIMVTRSCAVIAKNEDPDTGAPVGLEFLSLSQIVRIQDLQAVAA